MTLLVRLYLFLYLVRLPPQQQGYMDMDRIGQTLGQTVSKSCDIHIMLFICHSQIWTIDYMIKYNNVLCAGRGGNIMPPPSGFVLSNS